MKPFLLTFALLAIFVLVVISTTNAQQLASPPTTTAFFNNTTTTTTTTSPADKNITSPPKQEKPEFSIPDKYATPMLWAAGPVSIMAMLFGGSPVNGLYSTSALAVVEFSGCFRDLVDQELRFPESAWPGFTVGREEGQHIRGALVANITMQLSLVVILFAVGAVVATLQSAVKRRRRRVQSLRQQNILRSGSLASPMMMAKNGKMMNFHNNLNQQDEDEDAETSLFDRVSVAVWYPGSYILVSSLFLEGIVASIIRLFIIGPDAVDVVLSVIGCIVVSQIMVVAWTVVSKSFHGAGPVRFCSAYVRVAKKHHESTITRFLRSKTASTFLLGNYLWCAKKGTEDSRKNVLPEKARPAGLLVLPFRARNAEESGVIALGTRYFFVESCFAFVFAVCRGIFEPCEINIWVISAVSFLSTLTLVRVRPFNIPFYNTTAVWSNGAITASAVCIGLYHSNLAGETAKLAGEVIAMMAALGGSLPFALYLIRVILFAIVKAELCPVGLQEDELQLAGGGGGGGGSSSQPNFDNSILGFDSGKSGPNSGNNSPRGMKGGPDQSAMTTTDPSSPGGKNSSPRFSSNNKDGNNNNNDFSPATSTGSPRGGDGGNKTSLEDDLELEAILSSEKQPVNWPLRRANDLKLPPLPRPDYEDDGTNLFVRRNEKRDERPSIFSPEGMLERERLRQRRPKLPDLDTDDVILPIPQPTQNISGNGTPRTTSSGTMNNNNRSMSLNLGGPSSSSASPSPSGSPMMLMNSSSSRATSFGGNNNNNNNNRGSFSSSVPSNVPKQGASPLMEQYVI